MQVHITSPSYLKIDPGFPSLRMLKLPPNPVQTSVLEQTRPGLVKAKGNIVFRTLIPQGEHPGIIANTRFGTRLAADRYLFDFRSAFEIIKVGKMRVKRKAQKNTAIQLYFKHLQLD